MHKPLLLVLVGADLLVGRSGGGDSAPSSAPAQAAEKTWVRAHLDDV